MEILKVENLCKYYGKEGKSNFVKAVDNVSFKVDKGEFVSIVGKSGSGKSTLLHMMGGVDKPTSGKIYIDGVDIYSLKEEKLAIFRRREVGLIYQFFNLLPILNVEENINLPILLDGKKVDKKKFNEMVEKLGLETKLKNLPNELSGGQEQRVSIARALSNEPAIILADEPTGNLDTKNAREIMELLKYTNKSLGQTILMITHDEDLAVMADRMITIEDGKIIEDRKLV